MTDQYRSREREHWQAIAEQLGLAPEAEPSFPLASERRVESKPIVKPVVTRTEEESPRPEEESEAEVAAEETSFGQGEMEPDALFSDADDEPTSPGDRAPPVETHSDEAAQSGSERRPHRRGRRGRKNRDDGHTPSEDADPTRTTAVGRQREREGSDEQAPRRGRGRGRPKRPRSEEAPEETSTHVAAPECAAEDDLDDLDDFSEWNVPSWNELIASLYRPGR